MSRFTILVAYKTTVGSMSNTPTNYLVSRNSDVITNGIMVSGSATRLTVFLCFMVSNGADCTSIWALNINRSSTIAAIINRILMTHMSPLSDISGV